MNKLLILVLLLIVSPSLLCQELKVVTATWAPYNMEENGVLTGIGTDIVRATLDKADIEADIQILPWARAYKIAQDEPNTLIYTIIKLPIREPLFKWVGPIVPVRSVLHKLKSRTDIVLNTLDDAKAYSIGTTIRAAGHQALLKNGFEDGVNIRAFRSNSISVRTLFNGRTDLESSVELNFLYEANREGYAYDDVEVAWVLFENHGYMAFSKSTSDETVKRVRQAFEQLKAEGEVDSVIQRYISIYQNNKNGAN